jgi:thiol:disulfide interchange protein DsbC
MNPRRGYWRKEEKCVIYETTRGKSMRGKTLLFTVCFLFLSMSYAYGFSDREDDCSKCHVLKKDEAFNLLRGIIPSLKILDVRTGPFKGLWEVDIEGGGRKGVAYVDFSKKYVISGGIIDIKGRRNLTQERLTEINKVDVAQIPLSDALILGDKDAKHKIIVFDDPD